MYKLHDSINIDGDTFYNGKVDGNNYICYKENINKQKEISHALCGLFKYKYNDSSFIPYKNNVSVEMKGFKNKMKLFNMSKEDYERILNNIKIGCNLNILEKIPQYSSFEVIINNNSLSIRVSIHPTLLGEMLTLRLISPDKFYIYDCYNSNIPKGLTIIYGSPCSGKTSFAYYLLLKNHQYRIATIEDPIEYQLPDIIQAEGDYSINIKSLLRHNIDILFIGEIRDKKAAEAVNLSVLTGNTTITTIHANNKADIYKRFKEYSINLEDLNPKFIYMDNLVPKYETFI